MTIELFHNPQSRATMMHWLLEELGVPYTHVVPSLGSWVAATDLSNGELAQAVYNKSESAPVARRPIESLAAVAH